MPWPVSQYWMHNPFAIPTSTPTLLQLDDPLYPSALTTILWNSATCEQITAKYQYGTEGEIKWTAELKKREMVIEITRSAVLPGPEPIALVTIGTVFHYPIDFRNKIPSFQLDAPESSSNNRDERVWGAYKSESRWRACSPPKACFHCFRGVPTYTVLKNPYLQYTN